MNLKVNLGKDENNRDVNVDLAKDNIHFIILVGSTGSGKSIFHYYLYKQLIEQNNPNDLGFVFLDNTMVDFDGWNSPFVIDSVMGKHDIALNKFEELAEREDTGKDKVTIIHIEEMDMLNVSTPRFENALEKLLNHKNKNKIYVVFSTSRPGTDIITPKIKHLTDLMVVFILASREDSEFILGESLAENFSDPGERVAVFKDKRIRLKPFSAEDVEAALKYFY